MPPRKREEGLLYRLGWVLSWLVTRCFLRLKVMGRENVPASGAVLLVSNHQSFLDPLIVGAGMRRPICFMAKEELFHVPVLGFLIRRVGAFPVRRGTGDIAAMRAAIAILGQERVTNIFPEGMRTPDGEIHPVLPGVALLVRRTKATVIPVVIDGSFKSWPIGGKWPRPARVVICYGKPLHLESLPSAEIAGTIEKVFKQHLAELRSGVRPSGV